MIKLAHFKPHEFNHYVKMDHTFLQFLDHVRHIAGIPFYLTSDGRSKRSNEKAGGTSTSLHLFKFGEDGGVDKGAAAVDFVTAGSKARNIVRWREELWIVGAAAIKAEPYQIRSVQFEIVQGPTDWHLHLGLQALHSPIKNKITIKQD